MYSKYKGITDRDYSLTPPPGYDGSRFRRRSDGRDDTFPLYKNDANPASKPPKKDPLKCRAVTHDYAKDDPLLSQNSDYDLTCTDDSLCECHQKENQCCADCDRDEQPCPHKVSEVAEKSSGIMKFLQGLGNEEILLISLILLLAGGKSRSETETILILTLLLCVA